MHSSLYFLSLVLTIIAIEVAKNCTNVLPVNDSLSGIETERRKDKEKMAAFVAVVRKEETL